MTSAAELFYTRRSRFTRNDPELGSDSTPGRISHNNAVYYRQHHQQSGNNVRRDRIDLSDCGPLPRNSPRRPRRFAPPDRESTLLETGHSETASGDFRHAENENRIRDRLRISGSERLPGAVLLARERLRQRLRGASIGVSIYGNRRNSRVPTRIRRNNLTYPDDFINADAGDWRNSRVPTRIRRNNLTLTYLDDFINADAGDGDTDIFRGRLADTASGIDSLGRETNKRPPGLSQHALGLLRIEVFSNSDKGEEETQSRAVLECSICLDAFLEGDQLNCLPCGHRFHPCCLKPWLRTCGACPYCRAAIPVTSCRTKEKS